MPKLLQPFRSLLFIALPLALAILCPTGAAAQTFERPVLAPRITKAVDESSLVTLHGNTHPLAQAKSDSGPAPLSMPANRLLLVLTRSAQQEADLQVYLQSLQDANSPNYRRYLTPEDFGRRFGVQDEDLNAIQTWLTGHGFSINRISPGRTALEFSGTVAQVQSAFHTTIHRYTIGEQQHWANASDPRIPTALAPVVAGIAALNSFKPASQAVRGPDGLYSAATGTVTPAYTTGTARTGYYLYVTPADAATIYDTPTLLNANYTGATLDGTGVTIGIAGDSNITPSQNANYRATFGLPAKPTTVVIDGNDPGLNGDALEAYLDTQVASGIAPNANVILYTAANTELSYGLFLAVQRALDDNQVDILNVSFGACESAQGAAGNQYILNLWEQAAAQGIAVTVSTGDSGSAGCDNPNRETSASGPLAVNGLASTPFNIAVGGTDFDVLYSRFPISFNLYVDLTNALPNHRSALKYIPEEPWNNSTVANALLAQNTPWTALGYPGNDNIQSGGGGASNCIQSTQSTCGGGYLVPSWQTAFALDKTGRNLPDVSLLAGNGLYGALWGICTDLEVNAAGAALKNCAAGTRGNNFNLTGVGGTSAAAPAFAGILALVQQKTRSRLGQAAYTLYSLANSLYSTVFHDVTLGNNSVNCSSSNSDCKVNAGGFPYMTGFNAGKGYDEASGLGSVDATQLVNNWSSAARSATATTLQLNGASTPLTITHGQKVAVNASVSSAKGTPSGIVGLVDTINPATRPGSASFDQFILGSNGVASSSIDNLPGGSYSVSAHYSGSPYFAQSLSNAIPVTVAPESSTTLLSVSPEDPVFGQTSQSSYGFNYIFDAQLIGKSAPIFNGALQPNGIPNGSVTFKNGSATLGSAMLDNNGIAEMQIATLPVGDYSLVATFPGDLSFLASTSSPLQFTIQPAITQLTPADTSENSILQGKPITISTNLIDDSLGAPPTGTVRFSSGPTLVSQAPVVGIPAPSAALIRSNTVRGTASVTTSSIPPGMYYISTSYSGDKNYAAAANPSVSYLNVISAGSLTASITSAPLPNPVYTPQSFTVTVTVTGKSGNPIPTGTVNMYAAFGEGVSYISATTPLSKGSAAFTVPAYAFPAGADGFNVNYSGDSIYAPATTVILVNISYVNPTITIVPAAKTINYNQTLNVTVTASGLYPNIPLNGKIYIGGGLQSVLFPINNGTLSTTLPVGLLAVGSNSLGAYYQGDGKTYSPAAGFATVTVTGLTPAMASIPASSSINAVQPLNVTTSVSGPSGSPAPTGTVILKWSGGSTFGNLPGVAGRNQITLPVTFGQANQGSYTVTATYSGDNVYSPGATSFSEMVLPAPASLTLLSGSNQSTVYGSTFSRPLAVLARDAKGNPVPNVTVYFNPQGPGLSFIPPPAIPNYSDGILTGSNGQASLMAVATLVGNLSATASVDGAPNPITFTLTATKAPLTVTANNLTAPYNQPIPRLTYAATGFVNGDASSVLSGSPSLATTAKQGSPAGTYPITITQGTLTSANYTFTLTNGTLTITK